MAKDGHLRIEFRRGDFEFVMDAVFGDGSEEAVRLGDVMHTASQAIEWEGFGQQREAKER